MTRRRRLSDSDMELIRRTMPPSSTLTEEALQEMVDATPSLEEQENMERSIEREKDMTNPVTNIRLEYGTLRQGSRLSARLWFMFVTKTGAEIPLHKHGDALDKVLVRNVGGFKGSTYRSIAEYRLLQPCRIKLINNCSATGKINQVINIYIDLHPDAAAIEFAGVEEFGLFQGRGDIDYKDSSFRERHREYEMNDDIMKQFFGLRLLQPPRSVTAGKRKVRSLIY